MRTHKIKMEDDENCSQQCLLDLISSARTLLLRVDALQARVGRECGLHKFRRKVVAELEFLSSATSGAPAKKRWIVGSNLSNLKAVVDVAEREEGLLYVDRKMSYTDAQQKKHVVIVDLVVAGGARWIKVTARNVSLFLEYGRRNRR